MNKIVEILMRRDNMSLVEANKALRDARAMVNEGYDPEEVLHDEFGLEPDYIFDLI